MGIKSRRGVNTQLASTSSQVWALVIRVLPWVVVAPLFLVPFGAAIFAAPLSTSFSDASHAGNWIHAITEILQSSAVLVSLRFSLLQAFLSMLLSVVIALPGAWLLARFNFSGRKLYAALGAIPFAFPPILFSLGFVRAWGHNGLINSFLMSVFGLDAPPITLAYTFGGIVVAHALLNFPLVIAMITPVWRRLPRNQEDAARLLGAGEWRVFSTITFPALIPAIAAAASLVFLYCFMSFAIPLTLGGGPEFATLEVSIYAAISGDQDFGRAGALAALEGICAMGVLLLYTFFTGKAARALNQAPVIPGSLASLKPGLRIGARVWLLITGCFALSPVFALGISSFTSLSRWGASPTFSFDAWVRAFGEPASIQALGNSLVLALLVAIIALLVASLLLIGETRSPQGSVRKIFFALPVALSSVLLSVGYLVLFPLGASVWVLALIQATAAYPLAWRILSAARSRIPHNLDDAAAVLGAGKRRILYSIDLPLLRPALFSSVALCAAVSLGEINAALMLNLTDFPLLGLRAYRLMGSYQYPVACVLGLVVCIAGGLAFAAAERLSEPLSKDVK